MTTQHTPGPWKAAHAIQDDAAARYIWSMTDKATGHRELVATIPYAEGDHINADARLIASAPDLLAALQDLLAATEKTYDSRHERQAALDAIAKATGQEV
jgi:hypothetical protein